MDLTKLPGSNGSGEPVRAVVSTIRSPGSTVLEVDATTNWPTNFIGTSGNVITDSQGNKILDPATVTVFAAHIGTDGKLAIDGFAPGYTDKGNSVGQVVVIKPTTMWADWVSKALNNGFNPDGTLSKTALQTALNIGASSPDWTPLATAPSSVVNNGQRSYTLTYTNTDYTDRLQPGTRLRTTRTTAAPTQSTSLNGTNQYWNNTAPNKMTFTDDFVVSAWVKLTSYGMQSHIISRYNGTSGWDFNVQATGQVALGGFNAGSGNNSFIISYQSLPLNKWVHVTAQIDMSAFTNTSTTSYIMIDGTDVPSFVQRAGTNPTALVQAGNLEIGSWNGGLQPFNGKIAQAAVFSAKLTQDTVRGYMSQTLVGNEPNLASAWSFNGNGNDLNTTTPNNLNPQNSVVATNADSPFGTQGNGTVSSTLDYAIVQSVTKPATNTIVTVQVPEGDTVTTTGTLATTAFSSVRVPYGFPADRSKWTLVSILKTDINIVGPASGTYYRPGNTNSWNIVLPAGAWNAGYSMSAYADRSAASDIRVDSTLSTSTSAETNDQMTTTSQVISATVAVFALNANSDVTVAAQTPYVFLYRANAASILDLSTMGSRGKAMLYAINGYV